ncbi:MAG: hypothetical protein O3A25_01420 [Acidobacteria bacterium]|nr:hypothetical protein [Acidobacteriota bacterium]
MSDDDLRLYPTPFVHRHYICLSLDHCKQKYGTRIFAPADLDKGWHGNRRNISFDNVRLPDTKSLKRLPPEATPDQFDSSGPWPRHFRER